MGRESTTILNFNCDVVSDKLEDFIHHVIKTRRKAASMLLLVSHINQRMFGVVRYPNLELRLPQDQVALEFRELAGKHAPRTRFYVLRLEISIRIEPFEQTRVASAQRGYRYSAN